MMIDYRIAGCPTIKGNPCFIAVDSATDNDKTAACIYTRKKGRTTLHYVGDTLGAAKYIQRHKIFSLIKYCGGWVVFALTAYFLLAPLTQLALFSCFNLITGKNL